MAFPKPLRALAFVSFLLFIFLLFQPFRTPPRIEVKPEKTSDPVDGQDPNLERRAYDIVYSKGN